MGKRTIRNKQGAALLVAVVIMAVLMVLGLLLLLTAFSLFSTAARQMDSEQCHELALSLSEELQKDIEVSLEKYGDFQELVKGGRNPLYVYLRYELWQETNAWPYYNEDELNHNKMENVIRYFKLGGDGGMEESAASLVDSVRVEIYWEAEANAESKSDTGLVLTVICSKNGSQARVRNTFELHQMEYEGGVPEGSRTDNARNIIVEGENWKWDLIERQ